VLVVAAAVSVTAAALNAAEPQRKEAAPANTPSWLGEEMPLPLAVRTPADLALKGVAERQYLIFNLIATGKLAWDRGDFATAASKWEALLRLRNLDPEIDRVIRPLASEARTRAGGAPVAGAAPAPAPQAAAAPAPAPVPPPATPETGTATGPAAPVAGDNKVNVAGSVSGGGRLGPGGTVVWLKRADGSTPRPAPARAKVMNQVNKTFVPRVLPVTVGTKVDFKNQDQGIFHNVFSLSRGNDFDAGLYKAGLSYQRSFNTPGAVQILCNIHASMMGWVVVVDSPYYGQAESSGAFVIRGVPPGDYLVEAWHESTSKLYRSRLTVGPGGAQGVTVKMAGDRRAPTHLPDKYGKPRQAQLGY
jgi:plastocyanin